MTSARDLARVLMRRHRLAGNQPDSGSDSGPGPGPGSGSEPGPESGRILVLGIGFVVVLLALVLVVSAVTAIHLDRKRVLAVADATAAAVADTVAELPYYADDREGLLTDAMVRAAAEEYLAQVDVSSFDGVRALALGQPTGTDDGVTAVVTLVAVIDPPFTPRLVEDVVGPVEVSVTARARAFDRDPEP